MSADCGEELCIMCGIASAFYEPGDGNEGEEVPYYQEDIDWEDYLKEYLQVEDVISGDISEFKLKSILLYRRWFPRLKEFEAKCREENPVVEGQLLSKKEKAQLGIIESLVNKVRPKSWAEYNVPVYVVPLYAISAVKKYFAGSCDRAVFLTPEENEVWNEMYKHPKWVLFWWTELWWNVKEPPFDEWDAEKVYSVEYSDGTVPWMVRYGESDGPLSGGEKKDIWIWDGEEARFFKNMSVLIN